MFRSVVMAVMAYLLSFTINGSAKPTHFLRGTNGQDQWSVASSHQAGWLMTARFATLPAA